MADLPPEQHASYSALIDQILAAADLNTISAKAIRKQLQEKVDYDIAPRKKAITELIMERFDKAQNNQANGNAGDAEPAPTSNGAVKNEETPEQDDDGTPPQSNKRKASETEDDLSDAESSPAPKKKKKVVKAVFNTDETDEQLAARIQAELNGQVRSTRGGGAKRKPVSKPKKSKKKSASKIGAEDDSDLEGEDGEKPEKEKKGGFHKPMNLSEPLAALLGESQLSRPQTVKRIWAYVKERDLQEPTDKRNIICDEPLRAVFKSDKVHMFTMNKILANHLYPVDEATQHSS